MFIFRSDLKEVTDSWASAVGKLGIHMANARPTLDWIVDFGPDPTWGSLAHIGCAMAAHKLPDCGSTMTRLPCYRLLMSVPFMEIWKLRPPHPQAFLVLSCLFFCIPEVTCQVFCLLNFPKHCHLDAADCNHRGWWCRRPFPVTNFRGSLSRQEAPMLKCFHKLSDAEQTQASEIYDRKTAVE